MYVYNAGRVNRVLGVGVWSEGVGHRGERFVYVSVGSVGLLVGECG